MGIIALAIKIEDPGPAIFVQKRVGQNKKFFKLHKFRSMKMSTPHDVPTHMLDNPEQYITRVGRFLRKQNWKNITKDFFRRIAADMGYFYRQYEYYRAKARFVEPGFAYCRER